MQKDLPVNKIEDICDILQNKGLNIYRYKRSPTLINSELFKFADEKNLCIKQNYNHTNNFIVKTPFGESCLIDYMNYNALDFIKKEINHFKEKGFKKNAINLLMNEPSHFCNGDCNAKNNINNQINMPFIPGAKGNSLEKNTLPLACFQNGDENLNFLNMHNIYSLEESKNYFTAMIDIGIKRPLIFSRSIFPGAQQYTGKWLGYIEANWAGLKMSLIQTMINNVNFLIIIILYEKFLLNFCILLVDFYKNR